MEQLIKYLNNLWSQTIAPTLKSSWDKADKRTDRLIESVRDDIRINNPNDISNPIVEAQNATIEAIKNIPRVDIPKTDSAYSVNFYHYSPFVHWNFRKFSDRFID